MQPHSPVRESTRPLLHQPVRGLTGLGGVPVGAFLLKEDGDYLLLENSRMALSETGITSQPIIDGDDDGDYNGALDNTDNEITLGNDGSAKKGYFYFPETGIPQGSTIVDAYLTVTSSQSLNNVTVNLKLVGADEDDAARPQNAADADGRPRTTAAVYWNNVNAWAADTQYDSPSIKNIVQEVVDRPGFGSAFLLFVEDNGSTVASKRKIKSYNGDPAAAAELRVTYWAPAEIAPAAPSGLTLLSSQVAQASLTWIDNSTNETRFEIERSGDGVTYSTLGTAGAGITVYEDTTASSGNTYYYRVRACNTAGCSAYADSVNGLIATTKTVHSGAGADAVNASRIPRTQRSCFYAKGRYWLFYAEYDGGGQPYDFEYTTSTDGDTWEASTNLGTIPFADAQWTVLYDVDNDKLHVARNIQTSEPASPVHDGLEYRRGTPNADGSISWDAVWQTAIATGNQVGDFSLAVDEDGYAWVGYDDVIAPATGDALVIRNDNRDGTWSTTAGFPVTVHAGVTDHAFLVLSPISSGIYAIVNEWGVDDEAIGYTVDDDGTTNNEGDVTVEQVKCSIHYVASLDCLSISGVVHWVYMDVYGYIWHRSRSAGGVLSSETLVATPSHTTLGVSSPRISRDSSGGLYIGWTAGKRIYLRRSSGGTWGEIQELVYDDLDDYRENLMPALEPAEGTYQFTYLTDSYVVKHVNAVVR